MRKYLSSQEYQELGKEYYKKKEYQKALDAFTEGIEASTNPSIDLLDLRSATYQKLENLDGALRDSRRMIQLEKQNVKGYLRSGQILQKKKKLETALEIYRYGARNVPVSDRNFILLKGMRDRLERQLAPPKSLDPLTVLPVELAEMVLNYLTFKNRVNCLRVSRNWYRFIGSRESLWTVVDLSRAKKLVPGKFIRKCVDRSHGKITDIIFHKVFDADILRTIATRCSRLENIQLLSGSAGESLLEAVMCAKNLKTVSLSSGVSVTLDSVTQILRRRPSLVALECYSLIKGDTAADWVVDLPQLRKLVLHADREVDINMARVRVDELFQRAKNIEHLSISNFTGMFPSETINLLTSLHTIEIDRLTLGSPIPVPSSIRRICLTRLGKPTLAPLWQGVLVPFDAGIIEMADAGVPELIDLEISNYNSLGEAWESLVDTVSDGATETSLGTLRKVPKLRRFSLQDSGALDFNLSALETRATLLRLLALPSLSELEELCLRSCPVNDTMVEQFPQLFPNLKTLNLSRTNITGVSIKALVNNLKDLRWLGVDDCMSLSPDGVEWARQQGVHVQHQFGARLKNGRRVRESM